jgi:outer membrane protein assembly factor BamD
MAFISPAFVVLVRRMRRIARFCVAIAALLILAPDLSLARENDVEVADDAAAPKANVDSSTDQLAGKEMAVGRYFLGKHNYPAAINRFKAVVTRYHETRHVEEALERLTESYLAIGIVKEPQTAVAVLGRTFPSSLWYKDALDLLKKAGLEPHEDEDSWISRTFN